MLHKRPQPPAALDRIKIEQEAYDPEPPAVRDPAPRGPLLPVAIPKPNWRGEEDRSRRQDAEAELDPPPEPRPAKPVKKTSTPNLDRVRAWRKGEP